MGPFRVSPVRLTMTPSAQRHKGDVGLVPDRLAVMKVTQDELEGLRRSTAMVPPRPRERHPAPLGV
jgi:hypothetical protein